MTDVKPTIILLNFTDGNTPIQKQSLSDYIGGEKQDPTTCRLPQRTTSNEKTQIG